MNNPESDTTLFAIAGFTSTGKTRLGEQTVRILRSEYALQACFFSIGDIHRLLTNEPAIMHDSHETAEELARKTLKMTHIDIDEAGRIHLIYNGQKSRQTYDNGNHAAHVSGRGNISSIVDTFIEETIMPHFREFDFLGFDGRERNYADILFRTHAPDATRIEIRRIEQPECKPLSNEQILSDIHERDRKDSRFLIPLERESHNVVDINRTDPSNEANTVLAGKVAGLLVDFANGNIGPDFKTIEVS
jgi:cytidylate kinase